MDPLALSSIAIAAASLVLSAYVFKRQRETEGRAHFTAEWESPHALVFVNHGPGAAKNVRASVDGDDSATVNVPYIAALQPTRLRASRQLMAEIGPLRISWKDNRRLERTLEIHISNPPKSPAPRPRSRDDAIEKSVRAIAQEEIEADRKFHVRHRR